jgi:hypothetical protein
VGQSFSFEMTVEDGKKNGWPSPSPRSALAETGIAAGSLGPLGPITLIDYRALEPGQVTLSPYGILIDITE